MRRAFQLGRSEDTISAHAFSRYYTYSSEWHIPPSRGNRRTKWPSIPIPTCPEIRREFLWCGSEQNEAKNIQHDQYQYLHCLSSFSMFRFPRFPRGQGYLLRFSITSNLGIIIEKSQTRVGQQIKNRNSVEFLRQTI